MTTFVTDTNVTSRSVFLKLGGTGFGVPCNVQGRTKRGWQLPLAALPFICQRNICRQVISALIIKAVYALLMTTRFCQRCYFEVKHNLLWDKQ